MIWWERPPKAPIPYPDISGQAGTSPTREGSGFFLFMRDFWVVQHISTLRFLTALCVKEFAPQSNV